MFLVTGGCGFIGTRLVATLCRRGVPVRVLDDLSSGDAAGLPPEVELMIGDVADPAAAAKAVSGARGCFHLAAVASTQGAAAERARALRTNRVGTAAVLGAAAREGVPVVFASSAAVYGEADGPVVEDTPPAPLSAYGADKLDGERRLDTFGPPAVALRLFNVYGPGQRADSPYAAVIAAFLRCLDEGRPLTIQGDGLQTRDFVHVQDVVSGLIGAMDALQRGFRGGPYNLCSGAGITIRDLAGLIADLRGVRPAIRYAPPRPGDIRHSVGSSEKACSELGWVSQVPLADGLTRLMVVHS